MKTPDWFSFEGNGEGCAAKNRILSPAAVDCVSPLIPRCGRDTQSKAPRKLSERTVFLRCASPPSKFIPTWRPGLNRLARAARLSRAGPLHRLGRVTLGASMLYDCTFSHNTIWCPRSDSHYMHLPAAHALTHITCITLLLSLYVTLPTSPFCSRSSSH